MFKGNGLVRCAALLLLLAVSAPALQAPAWGEYPVHPELLHKLGPERDATWAYPLPPEPSGSDLLDLDWYIEFYPPAEDIVATAVWTITPTEALQDELVLEMGEELAIDGVYYEGSPADYSRDGWYVRIELEPALAAGQTAEVRIDYHGQVSIIDYYSEGMQMRFSHHQWRQQTHLYLPCFDYPSDKFTITQRLNVPAGWTMLANGVLEEVVDGGDGRQTHVWRMNHDCAMYVMWFGGRPAEELTYIEFTSEPFPVGYFCHPDESEGILENLAYLPDLIACYEEHFGPYGFDVLYHQTLNLGMEWQAMSDRPIVHEDAHMWFGDLLSPAHWNHSWLNEGFATWSELLWEEQPEADGDPIAKREDWHTFYVSYKYGSEFHLFPLVCNYRDSSPIYSKGAFVVEMLRRELGQEAFYDALRDYVARHRYGNVLTPDLQMALEEHYSSETHDDLSWFFDQWVYSPGHPYYHWNWELDDSGGEPAVTVYLNQVQPTFYGTPYEFETWVDGYIRYVDTTEQPFSLYNEHRRQSFSIPLEQDAEDVLFLRLNEEYTTPCLTKLVPNALELTAAVEGAGIRVNGEVIYGAFDGLRLYRVATDAGYLLDDPAPYDDWELLNEYPGDGGFVFHDTRLPGPGEYSYAVYAEDAGYPLYFYSNAVDWAEPAPARAAVSLPWPNPCGYRVRVAVELPAPATVELTLYDLAGRRVLGHSEPLAAGRHTVELDVGDLATGIYLLRARGGDADELRRLVISR